MTDHVHPSLEAVRTYDQAVRVTTSIRLPYVARAHVAFRVHGLRTGLNCFAEGGLLIW
jgi:hypothetical protein